MKKELKYFLLFFLAAVFLISSVHAQITLPNQDQIDKLQENANQFSDSPSDYLNQEWTKILEKNQFGRGILAFGDILHSLNPIIKVILGIDYSFSWYFLFAFLIWIAFFIFFFQLGKGVFQGKIIIGILISFIITSFMGMSGAIKQIDDALALFVKNSFLAIIIFLITVVIILLLSYFGDFFSKIVANYEKRLKELQTESDRKIIHSTAEGIREGMNTKK